MLRISVMNGSRTTRLKLEGKLAHEWVSEAEKAWSALSALNGRKRVVIDLLEVSFVDEPGRQLLAAMHRAGAELLGSGPMISALIEEIQQSRIEDAADGSNEDLARLHDTETEVEP